MSNKKKAKPDKPQGPTIAERMKTLQELQLHTGQVMDELERTKPGILIANMVPILKERLDMVTEWVFDDWPEEKQIEFAIAWEKKHQTNLEGMLAQLRQAVLLQNVPGVDSSKLRTG